MAEVSAAVSHQLERSQIELYGERGAAYAYPWTLFSVDEATNAELQRFVDSVPPLPRAWQPPARRLIRISALARPPCPSGA